MFDLVIKNGTIIDGSGKEKYKANIGIKKDRIKSIDSSTLKGRREINAEGFYVTPGFVDILNHTDGYLTLFDNPKNSSMIRQGVTTMICGNCGTSLAPLAPRETLKKIFKSSFTKSSVFIAPSKGEYLLKNTRRWADINGVNITWITFEEYLNEVEKRGVACNFATLVGYNTCRRIIAGDEARDMKYEEMKILRCMLEDSLESGALGISIGLAYSHANFIKTNELHRLFSILKTDRKLCAMHIRDEGKGFNKSLQEVFEIASKNDIPLEISHFKVPDDVSVDDILHKIDKNKNKGINVNFDFYPYTRSWAPLYLYLPDWLIQGGKDHLLKRLKDVDNKVYIVNELKEIGYNFKNFIITFASNNKILAGKKIEDIALNQGISVEEAVIDLLISNKADIICFSNKKLVKPYNLFKQIKNEHSIVASDGVAYDVDDKKNEQLVHPRCFDTFPKFIKEFVLDKKIIEIEEAIRKITYMPAKKAGLNKRGLVEAGYFADLVLLNPGNIDNKSTYENPYQYPEGVQAVIVNGKIALKEKDQSDELFGKVLKD